MKQVSAGVLITRKGNLLLGHATNNKHWDIFKGKIEIGESPIEAAIRELKEESGISVTAENLEDLGEFSYTKKKNLHLFLYVDSDEKIDAGDCYCHAKVGDDHPEMDAFKWVDFSEIGCYCVASMTKVLNKILRKLNK